MRYVEQSTWRVFYSCFIKALGGASARHESEGTPRLFCPRCGVFGEERAREDKLSSRKIKSPYSAAFTGCGFMLDEMVSLLPVLQSEDSGRLIRNEVSENKILRLGKAKTRERMMVEFKRRFDAMPPSFWKWFESLDRQGRIVALYYCLLRTYLVLKEVHLDLFLSRLKSADPTVSKADVTLHIHKIAAHDEFVEGWSDSTKGRVASSCLAFIRAVGMLDDEAGVLRPVQIDDGVASHFISRGESWFLEALGMPLFEIKRIRESE